MRITHVDTELLEKIKNDFAVLMRNIEFKAEHPNDERNLTDEQLFQQAIKVRNLFNSKDFIRGYLNI